MQTAVTHPSLEEYRAELTGYAHRMLASRFEAEDAVQETLMRALRSRDTFEGRGPLRSWLYRIARNVCLDMLTGRQGRPDRLDEDAVTDGRGIAAGHGTRLAWPNGDPAEVATTRESVRDALSLAVQSLAPRQRAVLLLRDVLRWRASEVAELLDTTVPSVNSALQRARATLAASDRKAAARQTDREAELLSARYVDAFARDDVSSLTALVHEDATRPRPAKRR